MSDLREIFEPLEQAPLTPSLPASEVRRRGERLRRRRTALTGVAAVAVAAVVVTGGVLAGGASTGSAPAPVPATQAPRSVAASPTSVASRIPAGFSLTHGLPDPGPDVHRSGSSSLTEPFTFQPCGSDPAAGVARSDFAEVRQAYAGGEIEVHQLAVYPRSSDASLAFEDLRSALEQCPTRDLGGGSVEHSALDEHGIGRSDDSMVVAVTNTQDGARTTYGSHYVLARVGNAILVTQAGGEFGGTAQALAEADDTERTVALGLVASMCPFATGGCNPGEKSLGTDGFGLLRIGMPAQDVVGNPDVPTFDGDTGGACRSGTVRGGGTFTVSKKLGLVAIWLGGDMVTPEQISADATEREVKAAYPNGHTDRHGYWVVPLGNSVQYEFGFNRNGTQSEGLLMRTDQDCFG